MGLLICWGTALDQVRWDESNDPKTAAIGAFGLYDPKRMTFAKINRSDMRIYKRRKAAIEKLIVEHKRLNRHVER